MTCRWIATIVILMGAVSHAQTCLLSFAMVPEGDTDLPLIEQTYDRLLETLGAKLAPETLRRMGAEGGDPFLVPDQLGDEFDGLRKHLRDYQELLRKRGWDRPEIRQTLASLSSKRAARSAEKEDALKRVVRKTLTDEIIDAGNWGSNYEISPDGKWLIFNDADFKTDGPFKIQTLNFETKEMKQYPAKGAVRSVAFSADGQRLLLFAKNHEIWTVPFAAGVPDFSKLIRITAPSGNSEGYSGRPLFTNDPDVIYVDNFTGGNSRIARIDLAKQTVTPVDLREIMQGNDQFMYVQGRYIDVQAIPGTKDLALHINGGESFKFRRYEIVTINPDGSASRKKTWGPHDTRQSFLKVLRWNSDGTPVLLLRDGKINSFDGSTETTVLDINAGTSVANFNIDVDRVQAHPNGVALIRVSDFWQTSTRQVWDLNRGTRLVTLPNDATDDILSPQGDKVYSLRPKIPTSTIRLGVTYLEGRGAP